MYDFAKTARIKANVVWHDAVTVRRCYTLALECPAISRTTADFRDTMDDQLSIYNCTNLDP